MAQGDLYRLLERVTKELQANMKTGKDGGSERYREKLNNQPHLLHLSSEEIQRQVLIQFEDFYRATNAVRDNRLSLTKAGGLPQYSRQTFGISTNSRSDAAYEVDRLADESTLLKQSEKKLIAEITDRFIVFVSSSLFKAQGLKITVERRIAKNHVILRLEKKDPSSKIDVFEVIKKKFLQEYKGRLVKGLERTELLFEKEKQERVLNLGHVTPVSFVKAAESLSGLESGIEGIISKYDNSAAAKVAADVLRVQMASKFKSIGPEIVKEFKSGLSVVKFESEAVNLTDSDYEAAILRDVRKALEEKFASITDWKTQESSNSLAQVIAATLIEDISKSKNVKITGKVKKNLKASSSSKTIKIDQPKVPTLNSGIAVGAINRPKPRPTPSRVSMQNLVPMLNQKLPELVKSNMGKNGALHNRTGRFAESVEVLSISGDGLNVGFTYQTDPYVVFESQGRRDPRPLIDVSIRQAAAGIMSTRFSTGRVR